MLTAIGRAARLLLFASALLAVLACSASPPASTPGTHATEAPRPTATPGAEPFSAARTDIGPVSTNPPGGMPSITEIITFPMAPREAVRRAVARAQVPRDPPFGALLGEPDAVHGRLMTYELAWERYSGGDPLPSFPHVHPRPSYGSCSWMARFPASAMCPGARTWRVRGSTIPGGWGGRVETGTLGSGRGDWLCAVAVGVPPGQASQH